MIDFKGTHFEKEIILWGVRWYVAYPMSYRQLEEMMGERGVTVDHSTLTIRGSSSMRRRLLNSSVAASVRWAEAGDLMKHT
jgi:transposase-like protein